VIWIKQFYAMVLPLFEQTNIICQDPVEMQMAKGQSASIPLIVSMAD